MDEERKNFKEEMENFLKSSLQINFLESILNFQVRILT